VTPRKSLIRTDDETWTIQHDEDGATWAALIEHQGGVWSATVVAESGALGAVVQREGMVAQRYVDSLSMPIERASRAALRGVHAPHLEGSVTATLRLFFSLAPRLADGEVARSTPSGDGEQNLGCACWICSAPPGYFS